MYPQNEKMSKKSRVWNFFYKESDTVATCCLCHKNYSRKGRGTTCLRNHLKSKHPAEFQTLSESDLKYMVKTEIGDSASSRSHLQLQVSELELEFELENRIFFLLTNSNLQPQADPLAVLQNEIYACDEKLALLLAQCDLSFQTLKSSAFQSFVKALQPRYTLHSLGYYENILCQEIYARMQAQLKQQLCQLDSVSLATSVWWQAGGPGLLCLSCHGISSDFQAKQFQLKCEPLDERGHNADMRHIISSASVELQLAKERIHCIIRDDGACSVQLLKLCVKHALESNEQLQQLDAKCMQIAKHFEQSQIAYNQLKYIHEKRLNREAFAHWCTEEQSSGSSWNAMFRLKACLLQLKDALSIYAEEYNMVKIYPDEWLDIDLCNRVIQPIEEIVHIWSDSTASSVIPLIAALRDSLRTDVHNFVSSVTICSFARKLLEELEARCAALITDIKYLMATYLDPRYKQAFFSQQEAQLVTDKILSHLCRPQLQDWQPPMKLATKSSGGGVKHESKIGSFLDNMLTLSSSSPAEAGGSSLQQSQSQVKNLLYLYNSEPRIERQNDPISWWAANPKYSILFPIVRQYLSTPAASVASERLFGQSRSLYGDMKSGLCPENVAKILFVKANFKALEQLL
ncbi:hypothetical protein KR222_002513 [Zaprionus bogoriensis]|nr:hypothetical protein KR222_002513 [Zaprionus bogoriensis]